MGLLLKACFDLGLYILCWVEVAVKCLYLEEGQES